MLQQDQVIEIFSQCGAIINGHFILSSGRHSGTFVQKALVFQYPDKTEILCKGLAEKIKRQYNNILIETTRLVGPALGGLIPAYETARHLQRPAIWVERSQGKMALKRGFELNSDDKVIIIEDVITTGLSTRETIAVIENQKAKVIAVACLIDRSCGKAKFDQPLISLARLDIPSYEPHEIPSELARLEAVKPGSR